MMTATTEPSFMFMDTEWQDALPLLRQTGFFTEEELQDPPVADRKLTDLVRRFTTTIGYADETGEMKPVGSGTFVRKADGEYGILTAGHVAGALRRAINRINHFHVFPGQVHKRLWVPVPCEWNWIHASGENNQCKKGPDIAWIPMPQETAGTLKSSLDVVFYNRARRRDEMKCEHYPVGIVSGFVEEISDLGNRTLNHYAAIMRRPEFTSRDGWDYGEYALALPCLPDTHEGTSGSAGWNVELALDGSGGHAEFLDGVVFFEGPPDDRKLFAHGKRSVSRVLGET